YHYDHQHLIDKIVCLTNADDHALRTTGLSCPMNNMDLCDYDNIDANNLTETSKTIRASQDNLKTITIISTSS
ncbi:12007_t:CDS:2, partial [Racocetra persica]